MWKKSGVIKNGKFQILVLIELFLFGYGILGLFRGEQSVCTLDMLDVALLGGSRQDGGYSVDSSAGVAGSWLTAGGFSLTPGVYRLVYSYEAEADEAGTIGISADGSVFRALLSNDVALYEGADTKSFRFYVTWKLGEEQNLQIVVTYSGSQTLTISGLEIIKTTAGSSILLFFVLVGSLLVNSLVMLYEYTKTYQLEKEWIMVRFGVPALAAAASLPLMVDYIIGGDGLGVRLLRIEALAESMGSGSLWSGMEYWRTDELSYMDPVFYFDVFLWVPALLRVIGFTMNFSYGTYVFVINLITAAAAYLIFSMIFRNKYVGMAGSLLCTLSPCRLNCIYGGLSGEEAASVTFESEVSGDLFSSTAWPAIGLTICAAIAVCAATKWIWKKANRTIRAIFITGLFGLCILYSMRQMSDILYTSEGVLRVYTAEALEELIR